MDKESLCLPFLCSVLLGKASLQRWQCRGWRCPYKCHQLLETKGTCWSSGKRPRPHRRTSAPTGTQGTQLDLVESRRMEKAAWFLLHKWSVSSAKWMILVVSNVEGYLYIEVIKKGIICRFTHCGKNEQGPPAITVGQGSGYRWWQELQQWEQRPYQTWNSSRST